MRRRLLPWLLILLLLALLWSPGFHWGERDSGSEVLPALRIVCVGGEKFVRCPAQCQVDEQGASHCRCQDFYYQRGDEPLQFSHSLCR